MVGETTIGPDSKVEQVLSQYSLAAEGWSDDFVENDTDRLLLALLLEQRDEDLIDAVASSRSATEQEQTTPSATYYSENFTATSDGPPDRLLDDRGWIDFGFVAERVDLRFTDSITVRFAEVGNDHTEITYRKSDKFADAIPVESRFVYVERAPSAESDPTVYLEGWP